MNKHSPEPWVTSAYGRFLGGARWTVLSSAESPNIVAKCEQEADAQRIIACVNFLRDVPTEVIEAGNIGTVVQAMYEFRQRIMSRKAAKAIRILKSR